MDTMYLSMHIVLVKCSGLSQLMAWLNPKRTWGLNIWPHTQFIWASPIFINQIIYMHVLETLLYTLSYVNKKIQIYSYSLRPKMIVRFICLARNLRLKCKYFCAKLSISRSLSTRQLPGVFQSS